MKIRVKYVVFAFLLAGPVLAFGWLLGTSSGARFLLGTVSHLFPIRIDVQRIDGRIIDKLILHQTEMKSSQLEIRVDRLLIRWQPVYLLAGKIAFDNVDADQVDIRDDRPESEVLPELTLPKIPGLLTMLTAEVKSFRIAQLTYHRRDRALLTSKNLSARASWNRGVLRLKHFGLETTKGRGEGTGEFSFPTSSLNINLMLSPGEPILGLDQLALNLKLQPGRLPGEIRGPIQLMGKLKSAERVKVTGNLAVTSDSLKLSHFVLSQLGRRGEATLDGEVNLATAEPFLNLRLKLRDVDLSKELIVAQKLTGEFDLQGRPSAYKGLFVLVNSGPTWQVERLTGSLEGNLNHVKISNFDGPWMDGTVKGHFEVTWNQEVQLTGSLQGRGLNPSRITPDWQGQINLNARGDLRLPKGSPLSANMKIHLLESRLRGKALIGDIEARVQEGRFFLSKAELRGNGFDLSAHGNLEERLDFAARVSDLGGLIPGSRGSFFAQGWTRWRNDHPAGSLSGEGRNVSFGDAKMKHVEIAARLDEGEKGVVDVKATVQELVYGSTSLDSLFMSATGAVGDHKAEMALHWPEGELKASLKGAYQKETWQGMVTHLSGKDPRQVSWSLFSPFPVTLTRNKLQFGPLEIGSRTGHKFKILTDLSFRPTRGFVEANWKQLDLGLFTLYEGKPHLAGHTTGQLKAEWMENDRLRVAASIEATGAIQSDSIKLESSRASLNFQWDEKGLQGSWKMALGKEGQADGQFTSSQPARLNLPERATVAANWKAIDLSLLKAWLPRDISLEGKSSGRLSGDWSKAALFETRGEMDISQGAMKWRNKEAMLSSTIQTANLDWSWRDALYANISLVLTNYGQIKGRVRLPLKARFPVTFQETGPLEVSVQGRIQENGLLATLFPGHIQESSGKVDLNLNATGTWAQPRLEAHLGIQKAGGRIRAAETPLKSGSAQNGRIREKTFPLELFRGAMHMNWDDKGLASSWEAILSGEGSIRGTLASSQPARLSLPERGKFDIRWDKIDLTLFRSLLPPALPLEGRLAGQLEGEWFEGFRFAVRGKTDISQGTLTWKEKEGFIGAKLETATLNFDWQEQALKGQISIAMKKFGHGKGTFLLPIPARFAAGIHSNGPVHLFFEGQFRENGLLPALFPDSIQESQGKMDLILKVDGTWRKPSLQGHLKLAGAGTYVPPAGIHLKDMEADIQFTRDRIQVVSFRAASGPGRIEGTAAFWMKGWKISRYEGHLEGERFQTVYLPEFRVLTSPRLNFEGTGEKITVRGEILVPEGEFLDLQAKELVRPSPDVIIVGIDQKAAPSAPLFPLEASIRILLGEKVQFKAEGIDARLGGSVTIKIRNAKELKAHGEIQVVEGHYSYYGQKLDVTRGRLLFDGPLENPTLDVLALRKIKGVSRWEEQLRELQVGVVVTGKLQSPVIRLYSQPSMADADILSYLVLGQPATTSRTEEQTDLLTRAAGALLSAGGSALAQSQLLGSLRIDTLAIQTGKGDISRSLVTVGKYLDPRLYVGVGGSLFTNTYQIILRYSLTKNIEIETKTGTQSGANVYFKIEFE